MMMMMMMMMMTMGSNCELRLKLPSARLVGWLGTRCYCALLVFVVVYLFLLPYFHDVMR